MEWMGGSYTADLLIQVAIGVTIGVVVGLLVGYKAATGRWPWQ